MNISRTARAALSCAMLSVLPCTVAAGQQIPAKTDVVVRTIDAIDSKDADLTREYAAGLDDDLVVDGVTISPRGSRATLRVVEAQNAGAVKGRASLTLMLVGLTVGGKVVAVQSAEVRSESGSQGQKATKMGGIGAAAGGVAGGLMGGKKGAATGVAAGAGAGVAVAALTGQRVQVPAETRLTFTLANPATPK